MSAIDLARLRTLAAAPGTDVVPISRAAADIGRTPIRARSEVVLARHPDAPGPVDLDVTTSVLSNSALVALGLCVGLAWSDRDRHPYPGEAVTFDDLTAAARALHIDVSASRHLIGAIRHVLTHARLLEVHDDVIRLGPIIAGWSEADLESFRRNLDVLPAPVKAPG